MFDNSTICPYTGLRSFTEDESIFFKGRDAQIDQITDLLQQNKFLMVTGASGEGKSSLIYAGLIPNARSGFFKTTYNNWQVVDFRPERTPLLNFAKALSSQMGHTDHQTVLTELGRGYSSLIELYKNSGWYYDESSSTWTKKTEEEKVTSKRQASNLLIIVDQFEEFFTNPENFHNNTPSEASQTTLNVLLETYKLALQENLPVYVVCTMRSDYIGQCTSFRGLAEAIGFSQFFVPRLKRNELKLIIEEPAVLNGNKISQRLVERLLFDLSEGIDQLPILQHALSHIWHAANDGNEEMDLIHYAMAGGMAMEDLPEEDKPRFNTWYNSIPEYQKNLYYTPGIKRIIEIHANNLYEEAYSYLKQRRPNAQLTVHEVKNVVALTFACLTRIDDSRAIRNRMTLEEITGIINKPEISIDIVNDILGIFREPNNSFIRPFITDDASSKELPGSAVLDITHESLIRNWGQLNKWANKEYDYYVTFLDFRKQLNRWLKSGKSKNYLLPIGPLSYFENWEQECKPNKYWIYRYEGNNGVWPDTIEEADELLNESHEFLSRSNRKVIVTRTFMRYGANRIAAVFGALVVLVLSAFYLYDADKKQNDNVIIEVNKRGHTLLASVDISATDKADYLLVNERRNPGAILQYLNSLNDADEKSMLATEIYNRLLYQNKKFKGPFKNDLIKFIYTHISSHTSHSDNVNDEVTEHNKLAAIAAYDYYYNKDSVALALEKLVNENVYFIIVNNDDSTNNLTPSNINRGLQFYLTFNNPGKADIENLISLYSPFVSVQSRENFNRLYPKGSQTRDGRIRIGYNGGYHTIASLYAAMGDEQNLTRALDSLNITKDYYTGIPFNNYANLLGYLYQYDHHKIVPAIVKVLKQHTSKSGIGIYEDLLDRAGYLKYLYSSNLNSFISESNAGYFGPNLCFINPALLKQMYSDAENEIMKSGNENERFYLSALLYKQQAIYNQKYAFDREDKIDQNEINELLHRSIQNFNKVSNNYLEQEVKVNYTYYGGGPRERSMSRRALYIYPDHMDGYFSDSYHSTLFFDYLVSNNMLSALYRQSDDLELLTYWVSNYYEKYSFFGEETYKNNQALSMEKLGQIKEFIDQSALATNFDFNLYNIILANDHFSQGNKEEALQYYKSLKPEDYLRTAKHYEYLNEAFFLNQIRDLAINLMKVGMLPEAVDQIESYERKSHKILAYIFLADAQHDLNYSPLTFDFLDSAYSSQNSIKQRDLILDEDYRVNLILTLAKIGGSQADKLAWNVIKSMDESIKNPGLEIIVSGYAAGGNYYQAITSMHKSLTESMELRCYKSILYYDHFLHADVSNELEWTGMDREVEQNLTYQFNVRRL